MHCLQLKGAYHSAILSGLIQSAGSRDSKMGSLFRHALVHHAMTEAKTQDNSDTSYLARSFVLKTRTLGSRVSKAPSVEERSRMHLPLLRCLTALIEAGALNPIFQTASRVHSDPNALGLDLVISLTLLASYQHSSDVKKICAAVDALWPIFLPRQCLLRYLHTVLLPRFSNVCIPHTRAPVLTLQNNYMLG